MKKKKYQSIENVKSKYGLLFVSHWIVGFVLLFLFPLVQSIVYSFSDVTLNSDGVKTEFIGLETYKYYLREDPEFFNNLFSDIGSLVYSLPIILLLSLVIAIILNQNFKGRLFFRALYFVPVIIASGVVMDLLVVQDEETIVAGVNTAITSSLFDVEDVMGWFNLPESIAEYVKIIINNIFDLLWNCGIQTVLFIAGLQSIPKSLYEASRVEGATKWEEFWFITFPMLGSVTFLVAVFTIVDTFVNTQRNVIRLATSLMEKGIYDSSSTMLWFYFLSVGLIMGVFMYLYNRFLLKRWK